MEEIRQSKVATHFVECKLNGDTPAFTYKLKDGWSDLKLGRILFQREGLDKMLE
jgi:DNA mismatch repair protein MutS